jgi:hypothetical protein
LVFPAAGIADPAPSLALIPPIPPFVQKVPDQRPKVVYAGLMTFPRRQAHVALQRNM